MRLQDFALERFFARWEFSAELLLCASDLEGWPMAELLELAGDEDLLRWRDLRLGPETRLCVPPSRGCMNAFPPTRCWSSPAPKRRSSL